MTLQLVSLCVLSGALLIVLILGDSKKLTSTLVGTLFGILMGIAVTSLWNELKAEKRLSSPTPDEITSAVGFGEDDATKRFEELNFTIQMPDGPWVEMDAKAMGSDACYVVRQPKNKLYASIVVEPSSIILTADSMTEVVRTYAKSINSRDFQVLEPLTLAGIPSRCASYSMVTGGKTISYINIHHFDHHYARQFCVAVEGVVFPTELRKTATRLIKGFKLIDPNRVGASSQAILQPQAFPAWECEVKAGGEGWNVVSDDEKIPGSIWYGNHRGTGYMMVVPYNLKGLEVDSEALMRGLLSGSTDRKLPDNATVEKFPVKNGEGTEYTYTEKLEKLGEYARLTRVIRRGDAAWLVEAGSKTSTPGYLAEMTHAVDSFQLLEPRSLLLSENYSVLVHRPVNSGHIMRFPFLGRFS